jgi:hypothetical protein
MHQRQLVQARSAEAPDQASSATRAAGTFKQMRSIRLWPPMAFSMQDQGQDREPEASEIGDCRRKAIALKSLWHRERRHTHLREAVEGPDTAIKVK